MVETSGIQSMQYGSSNHHPTRRGLAETVEVKKKEKQTKKKPKNESLKEETSTKEPTG